VRRDQLFDASGDNGDGLFSARLDPAGRFGFGFGRARSLILDGKATNVFQVEAT